MHSLVLDIGIVAAGSSLNEPLLLLKLFHRSRVHVTKLLWSWSPVVLVGPFFFVSVWIDANFGSLE